MLLADRLQLWAATIDVLFSFDFYLFFYIIYSTDLCSVLLGLGEQIFLDTNQLACCLPSFYITLTNRQCWLCVSLGLIKDPFFFLLVSKLSQDVSLHLRSTMGIILVEINLDFLLECQSCIAVTKATCWWEMHSFFAHTREPGANLPRIVKVHYLFYIFKSNLSQIDIFSQVLST